MRKEQRDFIKECGKIYTRELRKDFDMEIANDHYLPQQAFKSCAARAKGLQHAAQVAVDNFTSLCILLHREEINSEQREDEKTILVASMESEDVTTATSYGWWKN